MLFHVIVIVCSPDADPVKGDTPKYFYQSVNAWKPSATQTIYRGCPQRHWIIFASALVIIVIITAPFSYDVAKI